MGDKAGLCRAAGRQGGALKVELAARGCRNPNAPSVTALECDMAGIAWALKNVGEVEINRRLKAAGCPAG